ncbi:MAG: response regulator [Lachnospiraceae bacterium]|nr:response regulator [Lachnospiraceae bacterium]
MKFTPAGGSVELVVRKKNSFGGRTTMEFIITDTGVGISKEFLPHLFDAFAQEDSSSTGKYSSTGLGMAITKNIVEMMNGNIAVESEKNKGTKFTVTVTLQDSERSLSKIAPEEIDVKELSVLIVDDDPLACENAEIVLRKAGISAEIAASGEDAVERVELRHARMEPYDLILIDWKMPEWTASRQREEYGRSPEASLRS